MELQYSDIVSKVLADHRDDIWMERELMMMRSELEEFKRIVETAFVKKCPSGLCTLNCHLLDRRVENLELSESISFTDRKPFEHFKVLIKKSKPVKR